MQKSVKLLWQIVLWGTVAFFLLILLTNWGLFGYMPSLSELENPNSSLASEVLASDGTPLGKFYDEQDRTLCDYKDISPNVINALVATEDERFFKHSGIDPKSTIAIPFYLLTGKRRGSSTITQQLAKNLFPRQNENFLTLPFIKLKEWIVAIKLERNFTKEEIITLYLNTVGYSENVYGIKNASRTFFNKNPDRLSVEEAAILVGMLKGNTVYNPRRNPKAALARRNTVISQMEKNGYLTPAQAAAAKATPIRLQYVKLDHNNGLAPYFREYLRGEMKKWCKEHKKPDGSPYNLYRDGLKIYTTINARMQSYAEEAVKKHLADLQKIFSQQSQIKTGSVWKQYHSYLVRYMKESDRYQSMKEEGASDEEINKAFQTKIPMKVFAWNPARNDEIDTVMTPLDSIKYMRAILQSGFMVMDPESGEVKAWVGGPDFRYFKYDHVNINTKRQVGSTIKPIWYTFALMNGFTPNTIVPNVPQEFPAYHWVSHNAEGGGGSSVTLAEALAKSLNHVSAYLFKQFGAKALVDFAKNKCGIESDIPPYPSISLGTPEISMYEMIRTYSMFPGKGFIAEPVYILRIEDRNGNVLQTFTPQKRLVIDENTAYTMVRMMQGVTAPGGTAARLRFRYGLRGEMAGKTGTTNDYQDGWFIGYTPQLLAGAWVGCENNFLHFNSLTYGQGANTGLPIWAYFFQKVYADKTLGINPGATFERPATFNQDNFFQTNVDTIPAAQAEDVGNGNPNDYLRDSNPYTETTDRNHLSESTKDGKNKMEEQKRLPKAIYPPPKKEGKEPNDKPGGRAPSSHIQ